jgi:SOS response regulatory protein OraA/RecX
MKRLIYDGPVDTIDDNIIDAEFTEIIEPSWMERASQVAFYKYIDELTKPKKTRKVVDFLI